MITGKKEELDQYVKKLHCPDHPDKELVVAWHQDGFYVIRCGAGHYPEEAVETPTPTRQFRQGKLQPVDKTFSLIATKDLGTGEILAPDVIKALRSYARSYGLDADRGHVVLMYGAPYIGLDGYCYHADRTGKPYRLTSRPLTEDERKTYQVDNGDHAWISKVEILGVGGEFTGLGIVTRAEMTATSSKDTAKLRSPVVAAHPWQLAQKRAEWQAMRRAFPIGETKPAEEE
ncbi:MAG: hypothetical protein KKB38_20350 [Gammaproteobacteria bacterium]|nr:hypothetical protein [Gammaproteobacteria bacterium]